MTAQVVTVGVRVSSSTPSLAAVFRNDLGPADVGRRVSVRYRLSPEQRDGSATAPTMTDAVGVLHSWDGETIAVERRSGEHTPIPLPTIVAAKVVPPDTSVATVERMAALGWPARDSETQWPWLLRAHAGISQRANSCLALDPVAEHEGKRRRQDVIDWYRARDLQPRVQVIDPSLALDQFLAAGWDVGTENLFMTRSLRGESSLALSSEDKGIRITTSENSTSDWLSLCREAGTAKEQDFVALVNAISPVAFFTAYGESDKPLGIARASEARGWAGLTDVIVTPEARRRGVGSALGRAAIVWALGVGALNMYLQTQGDNDAAIALYTGLGFEAHHRYVYLQPPSER
jgi:N-acetylglutamate synthase